MLLLKIVRVDMSIQDVIISKDGNLVTD